MVTIAKNSNNIEFVKYAYQRGIVDYRINMDYEKEAYSSISTVNSLNKKDIKIYGDFQGVKMRIHLPDTYQDVKVRVNDILTFNYDSNNRTPSISNAEMVWKYLQCGHIISIADGKIEGVITQMSDYSLTIKFVKVDYVLRQNAGCSFIGDNIPIPHMTKNMCKKIAQSVAIKEKLINWVILSFVNSADEIKDFVSLMHSYGIKVMAKIETESGIKNLDSLVSCMDGFMIGRGDLKNTLKERYEVNYQLLLERMSHIKCDFKGVGTFFLSNYSQTKIETQQEIDDVYSIKALGFDYIMLSKEVVNSKYPYQTIDFLTKLCAN